MISWVITAGERLHTTVILSVPRLSAALIVPCVSWLARMVGKRHTEGMAAKQPPAG